MPDPDDESDPGDEERYSASLPDELNVEEALLVSGHQVGSCSDEALVFSVPYARLRRTLEELSPNCEKSGDELMTSLLAKDVIESQVHRPGFQVWLLQDEVVLRVE